MLLQQQIDDFILGVFFFFIYVFVTNSQQNVLTISMYPNSFTSNIVSHKASLMELYEVNAKRNFLDEQRRVLEFGRERTLKGKLENLQIVRN